MRAQLESTTGLRAIAAALAAVLLLLSGCEAQRRASENAAVQKETAQEINRICALPQTERDTELERIKKESGIVLQCGSR